MEKQHHQQVLDSYKTQHRMSRVLRVMTGPATRLQKKLGHFPFLKVYGLEGGELVMKDLGKMDLFYILKYEPQHLNHDLKSIHDQLMGMLVFLMQNEVVHRDIKLENIMASYNPEDKSVKLTLIDFADACHHRDATACMTRTCGTMDYLSPEYLSQGRFRDWKEMVAADIWAVGIVLYEILFHKTPLRMYNLKRGLATRIFRFYDKLLEKDWSGIGIDLFSTENMPSIPKLSTASVDFLPEYMITMENLLSVDPKRRLKFVRDYAKQHYPPVVISRTSSWPTDPSMTRTRRPKSY